MTNALNALRLRWRGRQAACQKVLDGGQAVFAAKHRIEGQVATLGECILELANAVEGIRPIPLNEASTEKLYRWAPRMVRIMDLMSEARRGPDPYDPPALAHIAEQLGDLADRDFLNDMYDLMKQLANRGTT